MKQFLIQVTGTPHEEKFHQRKLVCSVTNLKSNSDHLVIKAPSEEAERFNKLSPNSYYALRTDPETGEPNDFKYYQLSSYEIESDIEKYEEFGEEKTLSQITLNVIEIN